MRGLENTYVFWIGLFVVLIVAYLLPTLIGIIRGVEQLALVFLVNLIGAPTGVGWVAALILAFGPRRLPADLPLYPPPGATCDQAGRWMPARARAGRGNRDGHG
jgi:Superinfection immunity protein